MKGSPDILSCSRGKHLKGKDALEENGSVLGYDPPIQKMLERLKKVSLFD